MHLQPLCIYRLLRSMLVVTDLLIKGTSQTDCSPITKVQKWWDYLLVHCKQTKYGRIGAISILLQEGARTNTWQEHVANAGH